MTLSKSQVRKAGSTVRAYKIRHEVSIDEYQQALDVISQYRSSVSVPLGKRYHDLHHLLIQGAREGGAGRD